MPNVRQVRAKRKSKVFKGSNSAGIQVIYHFRLGRDIPGGYRVFISRDESRSLIHTSSYRANKNVGSFIAEMDEICPG